MYAKRKVSVSCSKIKNALRQNGSNITKMCDALNLNYGTICYCLQRGEIMPDYLEMISDYLEIDTEYLRNG